MSSAIYFLGMKLPEILF